MDRTTRWLCCYTLSAKPARKSAAFTGEFLVVNLVNIFESLSILDIEQFVRSKQEETLHLEFKTISKPDMSARNDRRNLATSLSGFANSDGG